MGGHLQGDWEEILHQVRRSNTVQVLMVDPPYRWTRQGISKLARGDERWRESLGFPKVYDMVTMDVMKYLEKNKVWDLCIQRGDVEMVQAAPGVSFKACGS